MKTMTLLEDGTALQVERNVKACLCGESIDEFTLRNVDLQKMSRMSPDELKLLIDQWSMRTVPVAVFPKRNTP